MDQYAQIQLHCSRSWGNKSHLSLKIHENLCMWDCLRFPAKVYALHENIFLCTKSLKMRSTKI